jgi:hypothetical protein
MGRCTRWHRIGRKSDRDAAGREFISRRSRRGLAIGAWKIPTAPATFYEWGFIAKPRLQRTIAGLYFAPRNSVCDQVLAPRAATRAHCGETFDIR